MKQYLKKFFMSFTPYQICYLASVLFITYTFIKFFPDMMLEDVSDSFVVTCSVISVLANPVCELLISKQSKLNFLVDIIFIEIPEFILCMSLGWYTIAIVTIVFWIPIDVVSYKRWSKFPDKEKEEETIVKGLSLTDDIVFVLVIVVFSFIVSKLISLIPGAADSFLDALSAAFGMTNGILLMLRYREQWYAWFITLVLYTILYVSSGSYIMLVTVAAMFVNTCYGFVKWLKYTKTHSEIVKTKEYDVSSNF